MLSDDAIKTAPGVRSRIGLRGLVAGQRAGGANVTVLVVEFAKAAARACVTLKATQDRPGPSSFGG